MASDIIYMDMLASTRARAKETAGYVAAIEKLKSQIDLSAAKSCVAIGAGFAESEIDFIARMMPNLRKLTAIEPDPNLAAQLRTRLSERLPFLLTINVCQQTVQEWSGLENPVDVVLLLHVVQHFTELERRQLLTRLHRDVIARNGYLVTLCGVDPCELRQVFQVLGLPQWTPDLGVFEREILECGFTILAEELIDYIFDLVDIEYDDECLAIFGKAFAKKSSKDEVLNAICLVAGSRTYLNCRSRLYISQK